MHKIFCDGCGVELDRNYMPSVGRLRKELDIGGKKFSIEVGATKNGKWNEGEICLECLFKVINEGQEVK